MTVITVIILLVLTEGSALGLQPSRAANTRKLFRKGPTIRRRRRSVQDIHRELGGYARRAYRMETEIFWKLHSHLVFYLIHDRNRNRNDIMYRNWAPNGRILASTRISCAIRYFAGGSPYDIAVMHGISHTSVFDSVWMVVDSVHACPELDIMFPTDHYEQLCMANAFKAKSDADFGNCVSTIDGILIWTNQPTEKDCIEAEVGAKKFLCCRKHKFGLNMQAACDANGKFVDVSICHPGATSDFLAFATSQLRYKLEQDGFLAPGLAFYGDNA